ncbi:hypothetical protein PENTCL1PPCAC_28196, partial [Pristionchus entomophagus]
MLSYFFLLSLTFGSTIAGLHVLNRIDIENIKKVMSREVEEEFSGRKNQEELKCLKEQFAESHNGNEEYFNIPTQFDINANRTDLFEGDIDLTPEQWQIALDFDPDNPMRRRQALTSTAQMWQPIGAPVIPYAFAPGFPTQFHQVVLDGMAFWEQRTCAKFRLATPSDVNAIVFNHDANGCSSMIGRLPRRRQQLNLAAPGCMTVTIVAHELSHAFGTLHVQSRSDRDQFIQIDFSNIIRGQEHNFRMEPRLSTYGLPYEFGSMQHYFAHA